MEPVPIDPDAPWLVNVAVLVLVLAIVPALTTWLVQRGTRREVTATRQVAEQARDQVQPDHGHSTADAVHRTESAVRALAESLQRVEEQQTTQGHDIGGLRGDVRQVRTDVQAVSRRLDDHVRSATD